MTCHEIPMKNGRRIMKYNRQWYKDNADWLKANPQYDDRKYKGKRSKRADDDKEYFINPAIKMLIDQGFRVEHAGPGVMKVISPTRKELH